jgi:hypothetical protein
MFRYTAKQKNFETKNNLYRLELENTKHKYKSGIILELEKFMSEQSRDNKTLSLENVNNSLYLKLRANNLMNEFYRKKKHRLNKFNAYSNMQRSENLLIQNFRKKFGNPDEVLIAFGDHSQTTGQMKHMEPTKDIGMRRLFRRYGYDVYLIDEYNTSCKCSRCGERVEKFMSRESRRDDAGNNYTSLIHGLLRCSSVNCKINYNRDYNACKNILKIAECIRTKVDRPEPLKRPNENSNKRYGNLTKRITNTR